MTTVDIVPFRMEGNSQHPLTMSSREIADLLGARHDNVKRTVERVAHSGAMTLPPLEEVSNPGFGPQTIAVYRLDKRSSLIVVAQLSPEFTARVVDRWQELEAVVAKPLDPMQVLNDPAAMRGLLLTYSEKVLALEAKVEEQGTQVAKLERIEAADGSMCLTDAAKTLKLRPIDLIRFMDSRRWIYKRPQNKSWIGYHDKIASGYLEHDDHLYVDREGRERVSTQVKVTGKGLVKLAELLNEKPH